METWENKIESALILLKSEKSLKLGELRLELKNSCDLIVIGWSACIFFQNLTNLKATEELHQIKEQFNLMIENSIELKTFTIGRSIEFSLFYDDYGKGSISICSEINGIIKWIANITN